MVAVENTHQVIAFKKARIIYHIIFVVLISLIFFLWDARDHDLRLRLFAAVMILYVACVACIFYLQPGYFRMTIIDENELQIRYYAMHLYNGKRKAIQFHVTKMKDYIIQKKPLGKCTLVLKIQASNHTATYPPISVSLLNKKQIQFLRSFLEKIKTEV